MAVFDFSNYRDYLQNVRANSKHRGFVAAIAKACKCQSAYVSQIFAGKSEFSLEQGEALNKFLQHDKDESHYLLLLILFERAGTAGLKKYYKEQIEQEKRRKREIKDRYRTSEHLSSDEKAVYYSTWIYAACHAGITLKQANTSQALAEFLGLPEQEVLPALKFLVECRLLSRSSDGFYEIGKMRMHLGSDSPFIAKHHTNWRLKALNDLERLNDSARGMHYSSVITVSANDVAKIEALVLECTDKVKNVVRQSDDTSELLCFNLDLFPIRS
jgi:uncharacterized protein (TIGR02147 family)